MFKTPQAGVGVVRSIRSAEPSSTPSLAPGMAAQKVKTKEVVVRTPQAWGSIINQKKGITEVSAERTATETLTAQKVEV